MSRRCKIWALVSLVAALMVLIPLGLRWRAQWSLSAYRKKLIASGEKLTVEELAPKHIPQATNAARFVRLASMIKPFWQFQPSLMHFIKPGVARVTWRQPQAMMVMVSDPTKPAIDVWPLLKDALGTNQQTMDELQALVDAGGIEFIEDYSLANIQNYNHLAGTREAITYFSARATFELHENRRQEALADLEFCGKVSECVARDPIMLDQMMFSSYLSMEAKESWEALQANGWTDGELARLQRQWDHRDILAPAALSLAMERARAPMAFQAARASRQALNGMGGDADVKNFGEIWNDFLLHASTVPNELFTTYPRYWGWRWIWSYRDEQRYMEFMQTMISGTRDAQQRRSVLSLLRDRAENPNLDPPIGGHFDVVAPITESTKRFIRDALRAQTVANIVTVAIALERFRLAHHAYPAALTNLTPEFVQTVPVDCMDGHDLRYHLKPDGTYLLYSVGSDGVDNGGDATPIEGKKPGFLNGRDSVWPRAATDEEVQAYEAEQTKPKAAGKK